MQSMDSWSDQTAGEVPSHRVRVKVLTRGLVLALLAFNVVLYRLATDRSSEVVAYTACDALGGFVWRLSASAEGGTALACTSDGKLIVWEAGSRPAVRVVCSNGAPNVRPAFASNASKLVVADRGEAIVVCDLATGRPARLSPAVGEIQALALSRDGGTLALADGAGVRLVDLASRRPFSRMGDEVHDVTSLAFSPDDRTLAVGCRDGLVWLWHLAEGRSCTAVRSHRTPVTSLAFTTDGTLLASASHVDDVVVVRSVANGEVLGRWKNHALVQDVAFAPGLRLLATAGRDGTVRMRDVSKSGPPRVVLREGSTITALGFSTDGKTLACGSTGLIRLYRAGELAEASAP